MTEKIADRHLARKAIVYVRQSSQKQIVSNPESRRLQYEMKSRLQSLGWRAIETVDDDLGLSAAGTANRIGFQRVVAEVCLGRIGAVAAREVSRFARNSRDWHQLIEMCSMVDTLLIDHEAVYDPRQANDRLLLGLKGSMSEYELDLLRQRSLEARWAKARRGELVIEAPVGFVKTEEQTLELDPDARVQNAIRLVFRKFFEFGSARQAQVWFVEHGITLPAQRRVNRRFETWWRRPTYGTIHRVLTEPIYAGAYAYGKTAGRSKVRDGALEKRRVRKQLPDWTVLIRDHHEGYVSWGEFETIQKTLAENVANYHGGSTGAARSGAALLAGLLRCRRCGRKLMVRYTGQRGSRVPRYCCQRGNSDHGEPRCISFGAVSVDEVVGGEVMRIVEPAAIEAAALAITEDNRRQEQLVDSLLLELKAARYAADRAWRQYDAIDPGNRLVANELERRWNAALSKVGELERRVDDEQKRTHQQLIADPNTLHGLAGELQAAWWDAEADHRLKKRIIRTLVAEIVADVDEGASEVELVLHWQGGVHSSVRVPRRRRGQSVSCTSPDTVEAIRVLALVCTDDVIASVLNRNGLKTGPGNRWTRQRVTSARRTHNVPKYDPKCSNGWMNLSDAAKYLGTTHKTMRRMVDAGRIKALHPLSDGPWVLQQADLDASQVRRALGERKGRGPGPNPDQLDLVIPSR